MLRIVLCDDEERARETLHFQLENILTDKEEIVYEFSSGKHAVNWLKKHPGEVDVLFLDVEMPEMDGLETAKQIRDFDKTIKLIFVTGYSDYVFDGYQVEAMDYILKPIKQEHLEQVLLRVREKINQIEMEVFCFRNIEGTYRIPYNSIYYFYSDKRKIFLVTKDREYEFYGKLDEVEKNGKNYLVRIHQRFLVNAKKVEQIGAQYIIIDNEKLPMSRACKEIAVRKLAEEMLTGENE